MTADIFASLQAFPQTQTIQPETQQTPLNGKDSLHGLFASLMNECIAESEAAADFSAQMLVIPEDVSELQNISEPQTMTFTGNNSFPQSVMNILADEAENSPDTPHAETISLTENALPSPEITDDDSDKVFWPDDEKPQTPAPELADDDLPSESPEPALAEDMPCELHDPSLAEDIHPEIPEHALADEIPHEIPEHEGAKDTSLKVQDAPAKSAKVSEESEDSDEPEKPHEPENDSAIPEVSAEFAGLAGVMTPQPQISAQPEIQDTQTPPERSAVLSQPSRQRRVQPETHAVNREQQEPTESHEVRADIPVNREAFSEDEGDSDAQQQNQNPQSQNHSSTQSQTQTQTRKADSRNLKTDSATQTPAAESRRTESHSDFGAYFEGVLNSRRSTARVSEPMPLNLRSAENFSQAQALRDGLTNVVRFIRADGVQKARVIIDPPALGRVSVELTSGTSGVEASIKVASEQIRQLVQDQISQLRMNLSQQGVQVAEFTVDVQQDNSGNHSQQGQEQYAGRFGFVDDSDDDEAEDFRIDLEEGLLYWVA